MKSSQLIKQGRYEEALAEINYMLRFPQTAAPPNVNILEDDQASIQPSISPYSYIGPPSQNPL
jgi:hypothetical protein